MVEYVTATDEAFVAILLKVYRTRIAFQVQAKRGQQWRLDGEEVTTQRLALELYRRGKEVVRLRPDLEPSLRKLGNQIGKYTIINAIRRAIDN